MLASRDKPYYLGCQIGDIPGGQALGLSGGLDLKHGQALELNMSTGAATSSASANTKGTYTEVFAAASLTSDAYALYLILPNSNFSRDSLVDIAFGGAGSEVVAIANILGSAPKSTGRRPLNMIYPIYVPRGTRISARCQCSTGSTQSQVWCTPILRNPFPRIYRSIETMGAATGDSGGTSIDPGGSANTDGSWTQMTAATTRRIRLLSIVFGNQINGARTDCEWLVDIGVGGAGSEVVIASDLYVRALSSSDYIAPIYYNLLPCDIPAGSRVSVRAQCTITDATDRLIDAVLYGAAI